MPGFSEGIVVIFQRRFGYIDCNAEVACCPCGSVTGCSSNMYPSEAAPGRGITCVLALILISSSFSIMISIVIGLIPWYWGRYWYRGTHPIVLALVDYNRE